jgi:catechol 2,3-dioxygenase-like lactoylglutathione lyase family enzyme
MAGDKKGKKDTKADKKARKAARKAEKKAIKRAEKQAAREAKVAKKTGRANEKTRKTAKGTKRAAGAGKRSLRKQPETLRLRSASPSFTVNDLQKSIAFYRDVLGFTEKERWERDGALRGMELVAGSVSVFLAQDDWQKGHDRAKGQGFRIHFDTAQDIDEVARRIQERGGTLAEGPKDQPWGGRYFAVADPDGFMITIATES